MLGRSLGRGAVVTTVAVFSLLLLFSARETGEWRGFVLSELQMLLPMAVAWRLFAQDLVE